MLPGVALVDTTAQSVSLVTVDETALPSLAGLCLPAWLMNSSGRWGTLLQPTRDWGASGATGAGICAIVFALPYSIGLENPVKPSAYLETTIVSYLTASSTRDLVHAAHQEVTREWWGLRDRFDLRVSEAVIQEASRGNPAAAARRLAALEGIEILQVTPAVSSLAVDLLRVAQMPEKAAIDAVHVAVAVLNDIHYLLTWNCAHIANPDIRARIEKACRDRGLSAPLICTPDELLGGLHEA